MNVSRQIPAWSVAAGQFAWSSPDHSGLMPPNFTPLPHFFVSSAMILPKSAGEPGSTVRPRKQPEAHLSSIWPESPWLDVVRPDHLAPLLGFVDNKLSEIGRRAANDCASEFGKPRLNSRVSQGRDDFIVEFCHDI